MLLISFLLQETSPYYIPLNLTESKMEELSDCPMKYLVPEEFSAFLVSMVLELIGYIIGGCGWMDILL